MTMQRMMRRVSKAANASFLTVYRNLLSVGLMGAVYRQHEDADIVNSAVEATMTDPTRFRMCRALAMGIAGDASYAVQTMSERIEQDPEDDTAKVVLGVAKMLAGESDWQFSIDNVLALSTNQTTRESAMKVLAYLQDLKK
jgi:hypothetical protein